MNRELRTRLILGPTMLAIVAGVYYADTRWTQGRLSAAVIGLLATFGAGEYVTMLRRAGQPVAAGVLVVFTALLCASAFVLEQSGWLDRELYPLAVGTFALVTVVAVRSLRESRMHQGVQAQALTLLGFVWIAWPLYLGQAMALRHLPSVLYVLLICKGGDIGGYLVGRAVGRRKLIPHVSKGKTVEGSLGSLAVSCAVAVALRELLTPPGAGLGLTAAVATGIILNLAAQFGDLVESLLKRSCGVKDSSNLLPAHGGVLDLVDSLLFALPAYYLHVVSLT